MLGQVSDKHVGSIEHFARFINNCSTEGRILSLDVESLFTCIPKSRVMDFLREKSGGFDLNPPPGLEPTYSFELNSKIFCDLVDLCLRYNQFEVEGSFYRQIHGLFMGSSISPPLAMMYMECWEENLYEQHIPDDIKASVWARYVDDCFVVYEHSEDKFSEFLNKLNSLDPFIKFTCEMAKPGIEVNLPEEVIEALPFLDLMVMRYRDPVTGALSNKLAIFRKACHSGSYVHSQSNVATSIKLSTIRNMFLRAYRYCDNLFLAAEERKIYDDFTKLGYNRKFIEKAKQSAKVGRNREIQIRAGLEEPQTTRERPRHRLYIPYHRRSNGLGYRLRQKGVELNMNNGASIGSYLAVKKRGLADPNCGVYMIPCEDTCGRVYVGQSKDIPKRLRDHAASVWRHSSQSYSVRQHVDKTGHNMKTELQLVAYKSKSLPHRLVIESCLMKLSNTIPNNKSNAFSKDIDLLAPMVLKGAPLDWRVISIAQPHFNQRAIPKKDKKFFSNNPAIATDGAEANSRPVPDRPDPPSTRSQRTRSEHPVP